MNNIKQNKSELDRKTQQPPPETNKNVPDWTLQNTYE